jgi:hypothetical protein
MEGIKTSFGRTIKRILHILNPLAGKGMAKKIRKHIKDTDETYMSQSPVETSRFIKKSCLEEPDTCFTVYGGDGTVHRAVNAVMNSGCADEAMLKIVPVGSGNDFSRSLDNMPSEFVTDIMQFNEKYAGAGWTMGTVTYTELSWNTQTPDIVYSNENSGWTYTVDCKVTVTAYTTLTKAGSIILYTQTSGGEWTDASTTTERSGPTVNTDQLRVYCGNSFTISVSDSNYEITKIKVYCSVFSNDQKC